MYSKSHQFTWFGIWTRTRYCATWNMPDRLALRVGGRGLFDFCAFVVFWYFILYFFLDVRNVSGIRGAQAWESTFRLLRMNVQGCHYILAICLTYRVEDHDGFRPGAPSHFFFFLFLLVFKVKIPECFLLLKIFSSPPNWAFCCWLHRMLDWRVLELQ